MLSITSLAALALAIAGAASEVTPSLSRQQIDALAQEIVTHTPEHIHFANGVTFSWVLYASKDRDAFPDVTKQVRELLAHRYVVYKTPDAVPAQFLRRDESGTSYVGGFAFQADIRYVGKNRVDVEYSDYEASLAASTQVVQYQWRGTGWIVISNGPISVS
jgi:hypothetical protein